jgi:hypothetical protein
MDLFEKYTGVVCLHLTSGQDLIGTVELDAGPIIVHKPMIPTLRSTDSQHLSVSLLPIRPYLTDVNRLEIQRNQVVFILPVNEDMEKLYRQTTSGITLAGADTRLIR